MDSNHSAFSQIITNDGNAIINALGYNKAGLIENFAECICRSLINADSAIFSVAYFKKSVIKYIADTIKLKNCTLKSLTIICSFDFDLTEPKAIRELLAIGKTYNIDIKIYTPKFNLKSRYLGFHAKVYIFETTSKFSLLIGSANLTRSAWTSNSEFGLFETYQINSKQYDSHIIKVLAWIAHLKQSFICSNDKSFEKNLARYESNRNEIISVEKETKRKNEISPSARVGNDWITIRPTSRIKDERGNIISNVYCIHPSGNKVIVRNTVDQPGYAIQNYDTKSTKSQLQIELLQKGILEETDDYADRPQKDVLCPIYKFTQQYAFNSIDEAVNAVYGFNYTKKISVIKTKFERMKKIKRKLTKT